MSKIIIYITLSLLYLVPSIGQQALPYQLNARKEAWLTGATLPFTGATILLNSKMKPLTRDAVSQLDVNKINGLDRFATNNWNLKIAHRSDWTLNTTMGLGAVSNFLLPVIFKRDEGYGKHMSTLGIIWMETNLVNYTLTELSKTIFKRNRPYLYGAKASDEFQLEKDARKSFFSGHTSFTAMNSFYMASIITGYQKGNAWNPVIWSVASLPPLLAAVQRVRAGKHFPTDVAVGYLVGAACGIFIPKLHEVKIPVKSTSSVYRQKSSGMTVSVNLLNVKMVF